MIVKSEENLTKSIKFVKLCGIFAIIYLVTELFSHHIPNIAYKFDLDPDLPPWISSRRIYFASITLLDCVASIIFILPIVKLLHACSVLQSEVQRSDENNVSKSINLIRKAAKMAIIILIVKIVLWLLNQPMSWVL